MGSVHNEVLSQNKGKHEWEAINFSQINVIKSLIKYRSEFDKFYEAKLYESHDPMVLNDIPQFYEIVEVTYLDLERLISKINLTNKQKFIIDRLMKGYTEQDICEINNWDITSVKSCFNTACKKIKEQNDIDWLEWIEISGNVKIPDDVKYKRCTVCGKDLRANEDNFGKHPNTKDNLQSVCKKCDSLRKSSNNTNI